MTDHSRVLFFDDDGDNISDCVRAGYRAVHTPAAFTRTALALLAAEKGEVRDALRHVRKALYVDSDFVMGHQLAARLHRQEGSEKDAEHSRMQALRVLHALPDQTEVPHSRGLTVAELRALLEGGRR